MEINNYLLQPPDEMTSKPALGSLLSTDASLCRQSQKSIYIPLELKCIISAHLNAKRDLQALRLSCKEFRIASQIPFGAFFKHRRHIVSRHSLEALVDITAHPFFGPLVKTVSLGTSGVARQDVLRAVEEVEGQDFHEHLRPLRIYNKHQAFIYSQQPQYLLERAFSNIRRHNNEITLGLFDDELREGYGSDRCFGLLRHERTRSDKLVPSSLDLMYKASSLAGVSLRGLTLDCNLDNLDYTNDHVNASRRLQEMNLDHTLQEIVLANAPSTGLRQGLCLTMKFHDTPGIAQCITPASLSYEDGALRLYNIKVGIYMEAELVELCFSHMGVIARLIQAQPLHRITLDGCLLEVQSFYRLLETSARTLRILDIRRTKQYHSPIQGSWIHVFDCLSSISLEHFHIEIPQDEEGLELLQEDSYTADGKPEVKNLLAMLIAQLGP